MFDIIIFIAWIFSYDALARPDIVRRVACFNRYDAGETFRRILLFTAMWEIACEPSVIWLLAYIYYCRREWFFGGARLDKCEYMILPIIFKSYFQYDVTSSVFYQLIIYYTRAMMLLSMYGYKKYKQITGLIRTFSDPKIEDKKHRPRSRSFSSGMYPKGFVAIDSDIDTKTGY
jgi:hypothetical protein